MLRIVGRSWIWRSSYRFSDTVPVPEKPKTEKKYVVFPTKIPIFPQYTYYTRINQALHDLIKQNNCKFVVTLPLREGAAAKELYPKSTEELVELIGRDIVEKELKEVPSKQEGTVSSNLTYDEIFNTIEEKAVKFIENIDDVYPIGSICKIGLRTMDDKNEYGAYLRSDIRIQINPEQYRDKKGVFVVSGTALKSESPAGENNLYTEVFELVKKIKTETNVPLPEVDSKIATRDIELLSGFLCSIPFLSREQMFTLFQTITLSKRLPLLLEHYNTYFKAMSIHMDTLKSKNVNPLTDDQIKQKLMEIHNYIKKMLNMTGAVDFINQIKKEMEEKKLPMEVRTIIDYELKNMSDMHEGNPQLNRKKHLVKTIMSYPFGVLSEDNYDIEKAQQILDEDHYGMKQVKQRILEFIAVGKLKGSFNAKVLLLYGPPGVGKSSIAKSIARCLGRSYERISLGGEHDPEMIRGHRKTYVGAYPGKIFDALKKCKTTNPVILLDEIDKIEAGRTGTLQEVIMEVLDPWQNKKFKDQFLDIEMDLSNVLFICTANSLDTIFPPLLDRLERIEVNGYTMHEKKEIFKRYLLKNALNESGLTLPEHAVNLNGEALQFLIDGYCREAGVRSLAQQTQKICQKAARYFVQNKPFKIQLDRSGVKEVLGLPKFENNAIFDKKTPVGVITGLAYTSLGGCTLSIETTKSNLESNTEKTRIGKLIVTGNLQEVMKESCQLAYSYAKYVLSTYFNSNYLQRNDVHLNFPEIEIGKDGPSAGISITSALLSLALNKPAVKQIAMTGEINLSGEVMPIGGVKEKILGAKREAIGTLIFPADNKRDVEELDAEVKENVQFVFVKDYSQVVKEVFDIDLHELLSQKKVEGVSSPTKKTGQESTN